MTAPTEPPAPAAPPKPPVIQYKNLQKETIVWPELSFEQLYQLADLVVAGNTPAVIALCANRSPAWVESLTFDCFRAVAKYCVAVNFRKLESLADSDPIMGLKIGPTRIQLAQMLISANSMISAAGRLAGAMPGDGTLPTPPPAAAAEETPAPSPGSPAASAPSGASPATGPTPGTSSA